MPKRSDIYCVLVTALGLGCAACSNEADRGFLQRAIEQCGAGTFARVAKSNSAGTSPFIVDFKGTGGGQHAAAACINSEVEANGLKRPTMTFGPEFGPETYDDPPVNPPTWNRESE